MPLYAAWALFIRCIRLFPTIFILHIMYFVSAYFFVLFEGAMSCFLNALCSSFDVGDFFFVFVMKIKEDCWKWEEVLEI